MACGAYISVFLNQMSIEPIEISAMHPKQMLDLLVFTLLVFPSTVGKCYLR